MMLFNFQHDSLLEHHACTIVEVLQMPKFNLWPPVCLQQHNVTADKPRNVLLLYCWSILYMIFHFNVRENNEI